MALRLIRIAVESIHGGDIGPLHWYAAAPQPRCWNRPVEVLAPGVIYHPKLPAKHFDAILSARREERCRVLRQHAKLAIPRMESSRADDGIK
ncbi:hypothetical protein ATB93_01830 [Sphingomonas sp. WG]|nr:hypothetical protein ATB93_01830 [Sphingomonas sp. WG]